MSLCSPWFDTGDLIGVTEGEFADGVLAEAVVLATDALYRLSGRQWPGVCDDVAEPGVPRGGWSSMPPWPGTVGWLADGWVDPWWSGVDFGRDTFTGRVITLPGYPVRTVTEVLVRGDVLDPADYTVRDRRELVRLVGTWPVSVEPHQITVTYTYGTPPPASAKLPVSAYARELAKAMTPGMQSTFGPDVTQEIRQARTVVYPSPQQFGSRPVGIRLVDRWLDDVNPKGLRRRPAIVSPDRPLTHRYS